MEESEITPTCCSRSIPRCATIDHLENVLPGTRFLPNFDETAPCVALAYRLPRGVLLLRNRSVLPRYRSRRARHEQCLVRIVHRVNRQRAALVGRAASVYTSDIHMYDYEDGSYHRRGERERGLVEARNEPAAKFIFVHYAHVQRYNKESFVSGDAC